MAVIGVGRFIQQRQDFEDAIARSYQVEMAARVNRLARGERPRRRGRPSPPRHDRRQELRDEISSDTRDTALLVAAGLIAGLTGALLLFSGLIASMRRPLEELVDAAGRLAGGDRSARVKVGGLSETATLGAAFNEMADELRARGEPARPARPAQRRVRPHRLARAAQPADLGPGLRRAADAGARQLTPKQVETVEIILDNCRHLVRLLNDLLDLARSDAGRLAIRPAADRAGAADRRRGADDARPDRGRRPDPEPASRARPAARSTSSPTGFAKYW